MSHVAPTGVLAAWFGVTREHRLTVSCSATEMRTMIVSYTSVVASTIVSEPPVASRQTQMPLSACHTIYHVRLVESRLKLESTSLLPGWPTSASCVEARLKIQLTGRLSSPVAPNSL